MQFSVGGSTLQQGRNGRQCLSLFSVSDADPVSGPFHWRMTNNSCGCDGSMVAPPPFSHRLFHNSTSSALPIRLFCTKNILLSCRLWTRCISLRRIQKRGFVLSVILEPSGSTPIVNRFFASTVAKESCKQPTRLIVRTIFTRLHRVRRSGIIRILPRCASDCCHRLEFSFLTTLIFFLAWLLSASNYPTLVRPSFRLP